MPNDTVVLYAVVGRAERQPILSVEKNHPLINELLTSEKTKRVAQWRDEGRDLSMCGFELEGV